MGVFLHLLGKSNQNLLSFLPKEKSQVTLSAKRLKWRLTFNYQPKELVPS